MTPSPSDPAAARFAAPLRAVVAFPEWSGGAGERIESVRARHDPQARAIAAHFTLVFPTSVAAAVVARAAEAAVRGVAPFDFAIERAIVVADAEAGSCHVFLVPSVGREGLATLHRRLHAGPLAAELRSERPFLPHVTVAALRRRAEGDALAERWNRGAVELRGRIVRIEVVEVASGEGAAVRGGVRCELGA